VVNCGVLNLQSYFIHLIRNGSEGCVGTELFIFRRVKCGILVVERLLAFAFV